MSAGIKPTAIVSYNHLGNNDGKNLQVRGRVRGRGRGRVIGVGLVRGRAGA